MLPSALLANLIVSCAAVLLVPQALECCAGHPRTVLESLSQGAELHRHSTSHGHAADELRERHAEQIDRLVAGEETGAAERSPAISPPSGHDMGEAPTSGAGHLISESSDDPGGEPGQLIEGDRRPTGRMVQPATPPPRCAG
jgi:hypothetical protein